MNIMTGLLRISMSNARSFAGARLWADMPIFSVFFRAACP